MNKYLEFQKIKKYKKIKISWNYCRVLSPPQEIKILSALLKIPRKIEIELFTQWPISHKKQSYNLLITFLIPLQIV